MSDNDSMLEKVRKLLALAEGASTPGEAESATAAAERLIQKYAIDTALLADKDGTKGKPTSTSVFIDNPYEVGKVVLLHAIAKAHNVETVRMHERKPTRVVLIGFASDVELVELLFASLLIQMTSALLGAGTPSYYTAGETRSFRASFVMGFANRVHERLQEASRAVQDETPGSALVLRDRSADVAAAVKELFPKTVQSRVSAGNNNNGRHAGDSAANRADLGQSRFGGARRSVSA